MIYLGYTVSLQEAFRMCGKSEEYDGSSESDLYANLMYYLKPYNIELHYAEKGVYILGTTLDLNLETATDTVIYILQTLTNLKDAILRAEIDTSRVYLLTLDGYEYKVAHAEPLFIEY